MNLAIVIFAVVAVCFQSISALSLPANFQKTVEKDEVECMKKMIKVVSTGESVDLGDFHTKSEKDKTKALWEEFRTLLKNGNKYAKHFEEGIADNMDKDDDSYFDKEFDEFLKGFKEASKEEKDDDSDEVTTCMLAEYFQFFHDKVQESSKDGRLGDSKVFMAMVKDIISSVDPEEKNFMESGSGLFSYALVVAGGLPDFVYSLLTPIVYIPDHIIERFIDEFPEALSKFDPKLYLTGLNTELANSLREGLDSSSSD